MKACNVDLDELKQSVQQQGLAGDITFTGLRNDIRDIFSVSDIIYSLSSKPESFGRTVLEPLPITLHIATAPAPKSPQAPSASA